MTTTLASFDSGHGDMVHDVQLDYYGTRLATASSDRGIKLFQVAGEQVTHIADLEGHEGPVWQVSWAHPKFGGVLASCSFDHRVIIWKEVEQSAWQQVFAAECHTSSVNSVAFAPHELGLMVVAASSDCSLSVLTHQPDGNWHTEKIDGAHTLGATSVSWAPAAPKGSLLSAKGPGAPVKRFVSGGCDNAIKVWYFNDVSRRWEQEPHPLAAHSDWVRDVAWAPSLGLPSNTIASASQDGKAMAWTEKPDGSWEPKLIHDFGAPVWRLSWSITGSILAISDSTNSVTLWKESIDGEWQQIAA